MGDNGNEQQVIKTCPFSGEECIQDKCAIWMEISMTKPGMMVPQKQGMCSFPAMVMVASTPKVMMAPPQQLNIPNIGKKF